MKITIDMTWKSGSTQRKEEHGNGKHKKLPKYLLKDIWFEAQIITMPCEVFNIYRNEMHGYNGPRAGRGKFKCTILRFLYHMWGNKMSLESSLW